jgi:PAS domain S-box-containing protein
VFEIAARPLRSPRGEIIGAVGVAIDVTEQAIARQALRESEERFGATFHQAPIGIAHLSLDGRILRANARLASLLGTDAGLLAGRRLSDWYDPPGPAEDEAAVRTLLSGGRTAWDAVRILRRPDEPSSRAAVSLSVIRGAQGEAKLVIVMVTPLPT